MSQLNTIHTLVSNTIHLKQISKTGTPTKILFNGTSYSAEPDWGGYIDREYLEINEKQDAEDAENTECLHRQCTKCGGSGRDANAKICVHGISCPCKNCSPYC
jgi:hypothetical protein